MKITIWSLKGGVGKTSIALNLALSCNCKIITNERYSYLTEILNEKELLQLGSNQKIPELEKSDRVIFDMGGRIDKRVVDCLKQSDFIIVPTTANDIDIQGCISTIYELQDYIEPEKIIIVVNKIEKKDSFEYVKKIIDSMKEENGEALYGKIFGIKKSRGLVNIFDRKKSIKDLVGEKRLYKRWYKEINEQFNDLTKFIEQNI